MKTFDISLAPDFDQVLFLRERELCAMLDAREDVAAEQSLAPVDEAQAETAALELEQVLAARSRLHDRSYGQCLDCDEAIDLARLVAMPVTAYCTACQAVHERTTEGAHHANPQF